MNKPMTTSCNQMDLEKQIVLRALELRQRRTFNLSAQRERFVFNGLSIGYANVNNRLKMA